MYRYLSLIVVAPETLSYLYWKRKRYGDAEREFRAEIGNDPKHARSFAYLGDTLIKTDRENDAVRR